MTYTINASNIYAKDKGYVIIVAFANDLHDPTKHFMIQGMHKYEEQDRILGQDTVYIEMSGNLQPDYGYIDSFVLNGNNLSIRLKRETSEKLGVDEEILINMTGGETQKTEAISMLKYISDIEGIKFVDQIE